MSNNQTAGLLVPSLWITNIHQKDLHQIGNIIVVRKKTKPIMNAWFASSCMMNLAEQAGRLLNQWAVWN